MAIVGTLLFIYKIMTSKKKQEEVKQESAPQKQQEAASEKKTATKKKSEESVKDEKAESKKTEKPVQDKKEQQAEKTPREPQLVTVNGEKVTHAHAFQSNKNENTWYFTAKLDGKQLRPMKMHADDVAAYQKKESSVEQLMKTYYPSKMEPKVSKEQYQAENKLSDGRVIDRINVYKEKDESKQDVGKYKLYAVVGDQKMSTTLSFQDLNSFFDRVTTPAKLVEKNFGEKLHLASAYEKFKMPEGVKPENIRIAKDKQTDKWTISADLGAKGKTEKKPLSFDDGYSFFTAKTATREQLAGKYLTNDIKSLMAPKQEKSVSMKM